MKSRRGRHRLPRRRLGAGLLAVAVLAIGGGVTVSALGSDPAPAHADALCDQMRAQYGSNWPCISVPTNTFQPTTNTPAPTTGANGAGSGGPQVGSNIGPGPGEGNGTPIVTVPGQAAPQPPAGGGNGGSAPIAPNAGGARPRAPQSVPPGDNTGQIPVAPSTAVPAVTTVPGAVTVNPEPGTPPHALDSGSKQPEIPLAAWVVAGAAAFAAANPRARSRLSRYSKGLRIPGNYRTLADDEIPFPITDGREYAYPDEDLPIRGGWQGDVQVTGNMRYYPDPGQKTGTLTFSDNATPIVSNGDARMTRNKVRVWVNGKDVTDQAKIEYTPTGVKGHIKVNELDTVVVRHVSTMQWSEGSGNTRVNRTSNGDVLGIVKVVNDADAMDKALDIGNGHGFAKHQARGDLPRGITTRDEYIDMIYRTIRWAPPQDHKTLSNNREAWWDGQRGAVVIYDPHGEGTAFSPSAGRRYFDDKLS